MNRTNTLSAAPEQDARPSAPTAGVAALSLVGVPTDLDTTKEMLQQLMLWSELHPHLARHLETAIEGLKFEVKRSPRRDRDAVMFALERSLGGAAIEDLIEDTRLLRTEVVTILEEFVTKGLVERRESGRLTAARYGRREYLYALTHKPAFSGPVARRGHDSATAAVTDHLRD